MIVAGNPRLLRRVGRQGCGVYLGAERQARWAQPRSTVSSADVPGGPQGGSGRKGIAIKRHPCCRGDISIASAASGCPQKTDTPLQLGQSGGSLTWAPQGQGGPAASRHPEQALARPHSACIGREQGSRAVPATPDLTLLWALARTPHCQGRTRGRGSWLGG